MTQLAIDAGTAALPRAHAFKIPPWGAIVFAIASAGLFALVVNLVHLGFSARWADPVGYVVALLEPIALTLPGYLILSVVLGWGKIEEEMDAVAGALKNASLTIACYAPAIWFYLVTSPVVGETRAFPVIAFSFGAAAFWVPFLWDLARRARASTNATTPLAASLISYAWLVLMFWAEVHLLVSWLARGITGRLS